MNKYHHVYLTTNIINGKQYIGDHSTNNLEKDKYLGSGILIVNAIKKYGKKNFIKKILEEFNTKEEAFQAQRNYIIKYNTLKPNGYNLSPTGGLGCKNCLLEESKKKISLAMSARIISDETRKKIGESQIGRIPWNVGKPHLEESKLKMSNTKKEKGSGKGEKNNMFGKQPYDIWIEKYGGEEAIRRKKELYEKRSKNTKVVNCEYCHKSIPLNVFNRCHGKKCKANEFQFEL